ncbi:Retrovirus-related Pol polyprotein from type-1 retrotransposable element R1 [Eumeta japonica]|uniref:Retrovirus-related Pol polyprotein from type-1 retrotransposable element R1 n=1 Tax=Eumeta variegata TaxID=151549 RepID=A0A4C1USB6_EUMVA|nr:Retrovirus-related Pol polyprotein from type-1 retrotransposable element R1 [Eumeta japonica]
MVATRELAEVARRERMDVVLVQEQYAAADDIIQTGADSKAGLLLVKTDIAVTTLAHMSNSHCMVVHVGPCDLYLVSCYFQYGDRIDPHLDHLGRVLTGLRGRRILIGVDCNAHSPMWHCERRHYVGRGSEAEYRRQQVEGFILGLNLILHNRENQPATFAGPRGESNVDLTMSTRGVDVRDWRVLDGAGSSDHRLITCRVGGADSTVARAEPVEEPVRFRDRGVDWDAFERMIQFRMGDIRWGATAAQVAESFSDVVEQVAKECLGVRKHRSYYGYEWWNEELDKLRVVTARKRKVWQRMKVIGGYREAAARAEFQKSRGRYRWTMREVQRAHFVKIAESGNADPWGIAYRAATGRCTAPRNVINGLALAEGYADDTSGAMSGMLRALCPDDDLTKDTRYHALVRIMATMVPSGRDVSNVGSVELGRIVGSLPNTAPGLDGISAVIVKHVWKAVQPEFVRVYEGCIQEGVFPKVWKSGRLLVIPKGNGRPATDPKAYRPITLLPVLGKILERIFLGLAKQLTNNINEQQHGFRVGRSTATALEGILGVVRGSAAKYVQLIFLDISGAFDNAWWPMVLVKAKRGGLPPNLYRLLNDYFNDRRVGFFVGSEVA